MFWWIIGGFAALFIVWYVFALVTFRSGLIRANVVSYFYRRIAHESHDEAMARVLASRYPKSSEKQRLVALALSESRHGGESPGDDLVQLVGHMYTLETGKQLWLEDGLDFYSEVRSEIARCERRFGIVLDSETSA